MHVSIKPQRAPMQIKLTFIEDDFVPEYDDVKLSIGNDAI